MHFEYWEKRMQGWPLVPALALLTDYRDWMANQFMRLLVQKEG